MAETATVETPMLPTLEQELTTFLNPEPEAKRPEKAAEVVVAPPKEGEAPAPETPAEPPEGSDIDKKLAEIPDAPEVKEEKSPLNEEQQQILKAFPTPDSAKQALTEANYYRELNTAITQNDFETVEAAFTSEAHEAFMEHLYQKYVANGNWIDRWISEKDGTAPVHRGLSALEQKIARLEAQLAEKDSSRAQETQKAQATQLHDSYERYYDNLFNKIQQEPESRETIMAVFSARISRDPQLLEAYRAGNFEALNRTWKAVVREQNSRDLALDKKREQVFQKQEQKKDLIHGQGAQMTTALPDDVKQVPKDKLDQWQTEQLQKLFSR